MTTLEELRDSAGRFGLVATENRIASWIRGCAIPDPGEWLSAENTALRVLLDLATFSSQRLYAANGQEDLWANVLARALGNSHRPAEYQTGYIATLAALTLASAGNFPSASVFAKRALATPDVGIVEQWMMRFLANLRQGLADASPPPLFVPYARSEDIALRTGREEDFAGASRVFWATCEQATEQLQPSDRYLLLLWTHVHSRLYELSAARILRELDFPHQGYAPALVETTSPLFYPPQAQILQEGLLTQPGDAVLVSLPTSTGKSLIGEIALVASLQWEPDKRWLAVYLAPYRALTDQLHIRTEGRLRHRQVDIACVKRRGDYLTDMSPIIEHRPTVLIATPEAFDALLRQWPSLYSCISACVFDEFHLLEQHQRGLRYEGLLGRFLQGAAGTGWPKVIGLSAVVTDVKEIREWMRIGDSRFFHTAWKPTGRRIAIASPDGRLHYFTLEEQHFQVRGTEPAWQGEVRLPYRISEAPSPPKNKFGRGRYQVAIRSLGEHIRENVVAVALDQHRRFQEPVLVLASSRTDTRAIVSQVRYHFHERMPDDRAYRLAVELEQRYPYLFTLRECLKHGVAYHNASLPDWVRRRLVDLMAQRDLHIVAATTTLAEGVDLPFRAVVMADWRTFQFGQWRPMATLLFRNIAGRCGRAGEFTEGDTIIVDNPGRETMGFGDRYQDYIALYVNPEPVSLRSSVEWSLDSDDEIKADTNAVLESQFLAYVAVCGDTDNVQRDYVQSLYAGRFTSAADYTENVTTSFTQDMLTEQKHPVLERRSPLGLTDFGTTVLMTGLSPRSGLALAHFLDTFKASEPPPKGRQARAEHEIRWEPVLASMWEKILVGSWVRELEGEWLSRYIKKRGHPVTKSNFLTVLMAWISGVPIETMGYLTLSNKSELKQEVEAWLTGDVGSPSARLEERIESLATFCENYFGNSWSWVCRGAAIIGRGIGHEELADELGRLAEQLSYGVSQAEAQRLLREGCPVDRARLDWVVRKYKQDTGKQELEDAPFLRWLQEEAERLGETPIGIYRNVRISGRDISQLDQFVQRRLSSGPSMQE